MAPQQLQQILSPSQLQALLHRQQQALLLQQQHLKEFYKKQQEQLHLQLIQQQPVKKTKELSPQQLVFQQILRLQQQQQVLGVQRPGQLQQQQQVLGVQRPGQLQQQQQVLGVQRPVLSCPFSPAGFSPAGIQQIWKELNNGRTEDKSTKQDSLDSPSITPVKVPGRQTSDHQSPPPRKTDCAVEAERGATRLLYARGVCNWPGCESVCENLRQFLKHLVSEHTLDDRSTAQCRVQMQVVQQLDRQLSKERERLQAMMAHLHLPPLEAQSLSGLVSEPGVAISGRLPASGSPDGARMSPSLLAPVSPSSQGLGGMSPSRSPCSRAIRRRHHPSLSSLSSENDYELYKNTDIRPPFTYATLIRQAIMEASDMQLTLNEIYSWFTRTFAYFRRNAATWKNAVRHNLSLHKCFVRVENVKGAVWTVDEVEYQRRRSQKFTGTPSLMKNMSSSLAFGAALNATLQTAVAEASLPGFNKGCISRSSVSHTQRNSSLDLDTYSDPDSSPQTQQSVFLNGEALNLEDQRSLMSLIKPDSLQQEQQEDITGKEEEQLFDLE